jgi:hypothetical protein
MLKLAGLILHYFVGFNADWDSDPTFYLNADQDPTKSTRIRADPDPDQTLKLQDKKFNFYMKKLLN